MRRQSAKTRGKGKKSSKVNQSLRKRLRLFLTGLLGSEMQSSLALVAE
jgi:hypothetical protein